ncbi:DUF4352 domain-containing protein [Asanoa sp. WMMD1127]|uniref:DUF4352 domain-containing protein n=1 Tax=Asanoa sp. WMMD1127 TaxID=3016107 RepID=UPI00241617E9|nr:DUF4352 domain-containing protein [Asanoa sp. WMMD1127]MDG4821806.1 DUF4352 domain-containing protein [Asanoa sp. WMMD1127]
MHKRPILTTVGLVLGAVIAIGCGSGGDSGDDVTVSSGAGDTSTSTPAAEEGKPERPVMAKMGDTITVDSSLFGQGDQVVAFTVAKGKQLKPANEFDDPKGVYYGVTLTVLVKAGSHFANPGDISLVAADGEVFETTFTMHDGLFDSADLGKGQKKAGLVVFDVPKAKLKGAQIQVKSFWDETAYGVWTI